MVFQADHSCKHRLYFKRYCMSCSLPIVYIDVNAVPGKVVYGNGIKVGAEVAVAFNSDLPKLPSSTIGLNSKLSLFPCRKCQQ